MPKFFDNWIEGKLKALGYSKRRPKAITSLFGGEKITTYREWDGWTDERYEQLAINSAWSYSDINLISSTLMGLALEVFQKQQENLIARVAHEFEELWEEPNKFMDGTWLTEYSSWWYLLRGEAYLWLVPDKTGTLVELWPIPADKMRPIPHPKKYIAGYAYSSPTGDLPLKAENVCFIRRPNPFHYHRGMSPISAYRLTLQADTSAAEWNRDTFKDELMLKMLINLPQETSDATFNSLKAELITELRDRGKRFWVARAGDVDVKVLGMTHKDAEFLSLRDFSRKEVDRIYLIPEGFWSESATRANSDAARTTFVEQAVYPQGRRFGAAITSQILHRYYGTDLVARYADARPKDRRLLVLERRQYWMVKTVNEARQDLGMKPVADAVIGDSLVPQVTYQRGVPISTVQQPPIKSLSKEASDDLRKWKSIVLRRFRKGEGVDYDFESDWIDDAVKAQIQADLSSVGSEEEIAEAFELAKDLLVPQDLGAPLEDALDGYEVTEEDLVEIRESFAEIANGQA